MDRAIVYAFDNEESKVVDTNEVIGIRKESFDVSIDYNLERSRRKMRAKNGCCS